MKRIAILLLIILAACSSSKNNYTDQQITTLQNAVDSRMLDLTFEWANPQATSAVNAMNSILPPGDTSARINLLSNPNYLQVIGDSLSLDMPYFGERQLGGTYGANDVGFDFEGKLENLTTTYNEKDKSYRLNFWFKEKQESCRVFLTLFPNKRANMRINSSHRTTISYTGNWKIYTKKETDS